MAPLETPVADGALRSMCRVVAKLLSPDVQDRKNPDPDLRHLQVCQKILQSQKEASNPPPQAQPPPSPRYAGRINSELHQSSLRTQPVVAADSVLVCDRMPFGYVSKLRCWVLGALGGNQHEKSHILRGA